MKVLHIRDCNECPYLKSDRHWYCHNKFENNKSAYHAGQTAEYQSELDWLFKFCPLKDVKE